MTEAVSTAISGLCAVCVARIAEAQHMDIKEPFDGPHEPGWRTVSGTEMYAVLHQWSHGYIHADAVRTTLPGLPEGEEQQAMLPVVMVDGTGLCADHVACLLDRRKPR